MKTVFKSILFLACAAVNAREIVVDDTPGAGDYDTIQAAELAANDGDTIVIKPNSDSRGYREEVTVTTPNLTITGKASKSSRMRTRGLKIGGAANKDESSKKRKKQDRGLKGKGGKGGDPFPFDALNERGFPSMYDQPDCPDVYIDGCDDSGDCDNTVLTISAPGVTIENLFIRHGAIEFASGSDGGKLLESCLLGDMEDIVVTSGSPNSITISNNFFQGGMASSVQLDGDSHQISYNLVVPCDDGFSIDGDDGQITNNKMFGCSDDTITYNGDRGTIADNDLHNTAVPIIYDGNNGTVTSNTVIGGGANGIEYVGDNPILTHNIVEFVSSDAIRVNCPSRASCTGGTVSYNEVFGGADDGEGIRIVRANQFTVKYNTISYSTEIGLDFYGDDSNIRFNTITRGGAESELEAGIEIGGDDNFIEDNTLNFNGFDGIKQSSGNNNVYRQNIVDGNGRAGIRVQSGTGTVISDNTIINNHGEGISIEGGTSTEVRDNKVTNNRIDVCSNVGVDTFAEGNTFTTGGFSTACESGLSS